MDTPDNGLSEAQLGDLVDAAYDKLTQLHEQSEAVRVNYLSDNLEEINSDSQTASSLLNDPNKDLLN
jgi:hypothetical protein